MNFSAFTCAALLLGLSADCWGGDLLAGFRNPPSEARPQTWWHWMNGNVLREGIVADLDAMAAIGLGGVTIFDAGCDVPPGPLAFGTAGWFETVRFAAHEAHRRGLEVILPNCSGWSSSGGPWVAPSNSMMFVEFGAVDVTGPGRRKVKLPRLHSKGGYAKDIAVLAIPADGKPRTIPNLDLKTLRHRYYLGEEKRETIPEGTFVRREDVRDLTSVRKGDSVEFAVPPGKWRILRIYFASNGKRNRAASGGGSGLECDKLRKEPARRHFDAYVGHLAKDIDGVLVDSYEVGCQNWTDGFERDFMSRRGYDLTPYLPVFAGYTVGSEEETERFLTDLRQTIRELFDESYIPGLAEKCHANGLKLHLEPYGNCPCENFTWGREADVPMCEFRFSPTELVVGFAAEVAEAARQNGRRIVAAEAYTARPKDGRWLETPFALKPSTDRVYALGVNRIVYHRFAHQPWVDPPRYPGMTLGYWGSHFERTQTWWNSAKPFIAYQSRCQWMLQQGEFVDRGARDGVWRIHRRKDGVDWHFLSTAKRTETTIRLADHCPDRRDAQIWDAEDGRIYACPEDRLTLRPLGSAFVVYGSKEKAEPMPTCDFRLAQTVEGCWRIDFPTNWYSGGKAVRTVTTELVDWTALSDDELKFFSGTATYRKTIALGAPTPNRLVLDLGEVREFAEVTANGRHYPPLWRTPYRVDITDALEGGATRRLDLVIRVTNLWPNRLIGDERTCAADSIFAPNGRLKAIPSFVREGKPSPTGRRTFATWRHWAASDTLLPSGLIGPVRLLEKIGEK